jgi:hypothetical protein
LLFYDFDMCTEVNYRYLMTYTIVFFPREVIQLKILCLLLLLLWFHCLWFSLKIFNSANYNAIHFLFMNPIFCFRQFHYSWDYWVSGLCPSSKILKEFGILEIRCVFLIQWKGGEDLPSWVHKIELISITGQHKSV